MQFGFAGFRPLLFCVAAACLFSLYVVKKLWNLCCNNESEYVLDNYRCRYVMLGHDDYSKFMWQAMNIFVMNKFRQKTFCILILNQSFVTLLPDVLSLNDLCILISVFQWKIRNNIKNLAFACHLSMRTVCQRIIDSFYKVNKYIKWVTTSWTHSIYYAPVLQRRWYEDE